MLKFICKDNHRIYLNPTTLCEMNNLKDLDNFKSLFSEDNLKNKNDNDENLLLDTLDITSSDWFEFISFIKYGVPMYYTLDIFNNSSQKEKFIYNLEKLNKTCSKFGGIKKFDEFYTDFLEKCKNIVPNYNPQEPSADYKKLYFWGIGSISYSYSMKLTYEKYSTDDGWTAGKIFIKKKELYIWFRKLKINNTNDINNNLFYNFDVK